MQGYSDLDRYLVHLLSCASLNQPLELYLQLNRQTPVFTVWLIICGTTDNIYGSINNQPLPLT